MTLTKSFDELFPRAMKCSIPEVDELLTLRKEAAAGMTKLIKTIEHEN